MATYKPPVQRSYQPPGRAATGRQFGEAARPGGRQFGEAGSLRPDTMTGFDRRDAVTGMQNEMNRESSLYNRIFRQQSRASRKGDIEAGKGALETMGAARAAGVSVGGISSFEQNRSFAAGTLGNIEEQTAMMEGGGQWQDDGQGGSNFVERTAAPVSGAQGIPEVPGMQQAPAASLANSFQDKMVSVAGSKLGSRADADGSIFERLTGVDPNRDPNIIALSGRPTKAFAGSDRGFYEQIGTGTPAQTGAPSPSPRKPNLAEKFAQDFPNTSKLLGLMEKMGPMSEPGYDPSADPELAQFKENEATLGREEAMRREVEDAKDPLRVKNMKDRVDRDKKRKKTLADLADLRTAQREADELYAGY